MRVIAGAYKGRRLTAPSGMATRPTADRIKESIFNILAGDIIKKRVLDLFAGTGALGIEALSRGASFAVFVDKQKAALAAIQKNIRNIGLKDRTRIVKGDLLRNIRLLQSYTQPFDLVFMDPPYEINALNPVLSLLVISGVLSQDARIVVEHSIQESVEPVPEGLILTDQRQFGKILVSFVDVVL